MAEAGSSTQSGGRGFLLLHLFSSWSLGARACPDTALGVRTPKSRPQSPGSPFPLSSKHLSLSLFLGPRDRGWELRFRGFPVRSCCLPFHSLGLQDLEASMPGQLDRGIPVLPIRTHLTRASPILLGTGCLRRGLWECPQSPRIPSLSPCPSPSPSLSFFPSVWDPGCLGSSLVPSHLPSPRSLHLCPSSGL